MGKREDRGKTKRETREQTMQARVDAACEVLISFGYELDGATRTETVRVPATQAPVGNHGKSGGVLRTFGGRPRFYLPRTDRYATVGAMTTFLYRRRGIEVLDGEAIPTVELDALRTVLQNLQQRKVEGR
jgi:hypothetical protein